MPKIYHNEIKKKRPKSSFNSILRISKSKRGCKVVKSSPKRNDIVTQTQVKTLSSNNDVFHVLPIVNVLEQYDLIYEILPDRAGKYSCFFLQDKFMNSYFKSYPEFVSFDIVCEIPELELNLCLFTSLDSNGQCEIVAMGLIKIGSFYGLSWLFDVFKKHNPNWRKIQVIMTNHDGSNNDVLKSAFSEKLILATFFHSVKNFKKDLININPKISTEDLTQCLQIFEYMIFVTSESGYGELLKQLKLMPPSVISMFKKNWHPKKEFWMLGLHFDTKVFFKPFNNFLFKVRKNLRPAVNTQETVENVIETFHASVMKLRKEKFQNFTCMFKHSVQFCKSHAALKYSKYLIRFGTELITEQLSIADNMKSVVRLSSGKYNISGTEAVVSINSCSCNFFIMLLLPCCHIFSLRSYLSLPLFVESLCSSVWIASNYENSYLQFYSSYISESKTEAESIEQNKRFRKLFDVSKALWNLMLDVPEDVSQERLESFQSILKAWKNHFKLTINIFEKQSELPCTTEVLADLPTDYWKEIYGISVYDLDSENEFSSLSLYENDEDLFCE